MASLEEALALTFNAHLQRYRFRFDRNRGGVDCKPRPLDPGAGPGRGVAEAGSRAGVVRSASHAVRQCVALSLSIRCVAFAIGVIVA